MMMRSMTELEVADIVEEVELIGCGTEGMISELRGRVVGRGKKLALRRMSQRIVKFATSLFLNSQFPGEASMFQSRKLFQVELKRSIEERQERVDKKEVVGWLISEPSIETREVTSHRMTVLLIRVTGN